MLSHFISRELLLMLLVSLSLTHLEAWSDLIVDELTWLHEKEITSHT